MVAFTRYVDSTRPDDSGDGLTPAAAKKTFAAARSGFGGGNNAILLKRGQVHEVSTSVSLPNGTSRSLPFILGAYGDGAKPIIQPEAGWNPVSSSYLAGAIQGQQFQLFEDIVFDALERTNMTSAHLISVIGAANIAGITVRRCEARNATLGGGFVCSHNGNSYAAYTITDILYDECLAHNNGSHGFFTGANSALVRKCKAYNNGKRTGAHGFSTSGGNATIVTAGWTLVSGTIYSRASTQEADGVFTDVTAYRSLYKNTLTPTAPSVGEFGWSSGTLYINIDAVANGPSITWTQSAYRITWEDCESWDNYAFYPYAYVEGAGFQTDDTTTGAKARRCRSWGNAGSGFTMNRNHSIEFDSCLAYGNASKGFTGQYSSELTIRGCTSIGNGIGGARYPYSSGEVITAVDHDSYALHVRGLHVIDTVISNPTRVAIACADSVTNASPSILSKIYWQGTALTNGSAISQFHCIQADPMIDSANYIPLANSPLIASGTHIGYRRDLTGAQRPNPPSIGAYDLMQLRPADYIAAAPPVDGITTENGSIFTDDSDNYILWQDEVIGRADFSNSFNSQYLLIMLDD